MEADELKERISAFPRWNYRFEFDGGVATPMADPGIINRHEQRRRYFFDPLLGLTGGSLRGRRVLDLGCNSGFWSLLALEAGAEFVLGVDAGRTYIEQANLVFEAKEIDRTRYRFDQGNVFDHDLVERFDVVLCLGLMERTAKPVELFKIMMRTGAEIIVIDTEVSRARMSLFEVDSLYDRDQVVDYRMVLIPSRQAVVELASEFELETVPLPQSISDYSGMKDYRNQRRVAFICSKTLSLEGLPRENRPMLPWWVTAMKAARTGPRGRH
jgi:tRNA (mo5U34)-methyltransferase